MNPAPPVTSTVPPRPSDDAILHLARCFSGLHSVAPKWQQLQELAVLLADRRRGSEEARQEEEEVCGSGQLWWWRGWEGGWKRTGGEEGGVGAVLRLLESGGRMRRRTRW